MKAKSKVYGIFGIGILLLVVADLAAHSLFYALHQGLLFSFNEESLIRSLTNPFFLSETLIELLFSGLVGVVWFSMQGRLRELHAQELVAVKESTTIRAYQEVMALLAQSIGRENTRILNKIQFRKAQGQNISPEIESASQNIASILSILSRIGYVDAYRVNHTGELSVQLNRELKRVGGG